MNSVAHQKCLPLQPTGQNGRRLNGSAQRSAVALHCVSLAYRAGTRRFDAPCDPGGSTASLLTRFLKRDTGARTFVVGILVAALAVGGAFAQADLKAQAEEAFRNSPDKPEDFHFLPKPFSLKQLTSKVKEVLEEA